MSATISNPELETSFTNGSGQGRWMVVIYNNDHNSMDQVVEILIRATNCDLREAMIETWEADHYGKAPVHFAEQSECERAAAIIQSIGVKTEVLPEWDS